MTTALADLTEREWQKQVVDLAKMLGWEFIYHTHDSRKSASGFPDLVMLRERQVALELKSERGKLSPPQQNWLRALLDAGQEAYVVRPSDWDALAEVLARRGPPFPPCDPGCMRERTRAECA